MKLMRVFLSALACAGLVACSGGSIAGKVTVAGGQSSGIAVFAYGPSSGAAVTGSDGAFTVNGLDDGDYVVRATVRGTDEEEQSSAVTVKGGKAAGDVTLAFHFSSGTVTGHVTFADGSDATGLSVVATGPETRSAATEAGGAFTLSNLKAGAYIVSVEAPSTREGRVSISVTASGTVDVGELRLTPVGHVSGTATYNGQPAVGVTVTVPGTSVSSVTDATGAFDLVSVPTGARTVFARVGEAPFFRTGSADVTVTRGENAAVALTLTDEAPKSGTVTGVVTYFTVNDPTNIVVSADGSGATSPVSASGSYSLSVPVGSWDIVATAPSFPKQLLGHVVVHEGETIALPGQRLSWYRKIWTLGPEEYVQNISNYSSNEVTNSLQLVTIASSGSSFYSDRLALLNVDTGELRFLATTSSFHNAELSRTGKYVTWASNSSPAVILYTVATGAMVSLPTPTNPSTWSVSDDETTLFISLGQRLLRYPIANLTNPQPFPTDGGVALGVAASSRDHWNVVSVSSGVATLTQVTTNSVQSIDAYNGQLANLSSLSPVTFGWADAGAALNLLIVPWDGGTPVNAGSFPFGTGFDSLRGTTATPCFVTSGPDTSWFCIKMNDGTRVNLPTDSAPLLVNELGTRAAFVTAPSDGGVNGFYETVLPPPATLTAIDSSQDGWNFSWLTPTRVYAMEANSNDGRKLRVVSNGVAAPVDTDTADGGYYVDGPLLQTMQKSTGKWRTMLGDAPFRTLPVNLGVTPTGHAVRSTPQTTKYAAVNFVSGARQFYMLLDEVGGTVAQAPFDGYCTGYAFRSGTYEFAECIRYGVSSDSDAYDFQRKIFITRDDETVDYGFEVGVESVRRGRMAVSSDQHSILLGTYGD